MEKNEIINMVQPFDSGDSSVIMVYDGGKNIKPVFIKAIQCSSKAFAKQWLKDRNYSKHKELGYYLNKKKGRIANILPTKYYR